VRTIGKSEQSGHSQMWAVPDNNPQAWVKLGKQIKRRLGSDSVHLDLSQVSQASSVFCAWVLSLHKLAQGAGCTLHLHGASQAVRAQLQAMDDLTIAAKPIESGSDGSFFEQAGAMSYWVAREVRAMVFLMSEMVYWNTWGLRKKQTIYPGSTFVQMSRLGSSALPIVIMLSFLIGLTLAFQSAVQLKQFGASLFMVSGIAISMVTEIGPLMTAIILAGRSGSSVTAEISSMVVGEEVRALKTMGVNPIHFLVLPRFRALSITGPLLTICSVLAGIMAGVTIAVFYLDLPGSLIWRELQWAISLNFFMQCLIKSTVFSWIIILVASNRGLWVKGGADSVGKATTSCVVMSISSIIFADAVFSFIFYW
jgi:phospholipid/cholesterol/gamma-HCH transport system permease protein